MVTAVSDNMFTEDVINDPYTYYGHLREEDPVHYNELYDLWVITRHDDLVWLTRHNELFSSAVFQERPAPALSHHLRHRPRPLRVRAGIPVPPVHPARPAGPPGYAQGGARLLHPPLHGGVAAHGQGGHQRPAGRGRGTGQHGRDARLCHAPAAAHHRRNDGRAQAGPPLHPRGGPRSCSTWAGANPGGCRTSPRASGR